MNNTTIKELMNIQTAPERIDMNHEMDETRKKMTPVRPQADRKDGGEIRRTKMRAALVGKFSVLASLVLMLAGRGAEAAGSKVE